MNPTASLSISNLSTSSGFVASPAARTPLPSCEDPASFLSSLRARLGSHDSSKTPEQEARRVAQEFVSIAFVQPLLKQLRETSNAAPPFAPTSAEKQFRGLYDEQIANRIVQASNWPLVDRITSDLLKRQNRASSASSSTV